MLPKIYDGRNKPVFWIAEEGYRQQSPLTNNYSVPTMLERQGDFSQSGVNIYDPVTHAQFPGNVIPQSRLNPIRVAIAAIYPHPPLSNLPFPTNPINRANTLT